MGTVDVGTPDVGTVTWAVWLSVPIGATSLAAMWSWWRGWRVRRAARPLTTSDAVRAHSAYLAALALPTSDGRRPAERDENH